MKRTVFFLILLVCFFETRLTCEAGTDVSAVNPAAASQGPKTIPDVEFKALFKDFICRQLGKDRADVIVSDLKVLGNRPLRAGVVSFQLFQKDQRQLQGLVRLIAVVRINGISEIKVRLSGWVDLFDYVVCASRTLKKGEVIRDQDLNSVRKNVSNLPDDILTSTQKAIGKAVKHGVREGSSLKAWMLENPPVVDRGKIVTIVAESSCLKITTPGKALMEGGKGDLIAVQNLMSKKKIHAKILDDSTVSVDF
jgi:flagellar basal body P-ring formation protein FlgA